MSDKKKKKMYNTVYSSPVLYTNIVYFGYGPKKGIKTEQIIFDEYNEICYLN